MQIKDYIKYIQEEIDKGKDYDEYVHLFKKYQKYLKDLLKQEPQNTIAICQLASVYFELRKSNEYVINILEKYLKNYSNHISDTQKARLYINLAFFYQDNAQEDIAIDYLNRAINIKTDIPNPYNALGIILYYNGQIKQAISMFEKAYNISKDLKYQHNYATSLLRDNQISKAKDIIQKALQIFPKEKYLLYNLAICHIHNKNIKSAIDIADQLAQDLENLELDIADIYYICNQYEKHNKIYEIEPYYPTSSWLAPYFYSLKQQGKHQELEQKLKEVIDQKTKDIKEEKNEQISQDYTQEDKEEYIQILQKEKSEIIEQYNKITKQNYKPKVEPYYYLIIDCYLIDCPRHQNYSYIPN